MYTDRICHVFRPHRWQAATDSAVLSLDGRTAPLEVSVGAISLMVGYVSTSTTTSTSSSSTTSSTVTVATGSSTTATTSTVTSGTSTSTTTTATATTATTTTSTSSTSTTMVGGSAWGNAIVSQVHHPAALCGGTVFKPTGCEPFTADQENELIRINGSLSVENTKLTTLAGRFPNLVVVNGELQITGNNALETLGNAFGSLQKVIGAMEISNLQSPGFSAASSMNAAFPALEQVGGSMTIRNLLYLLSLDGPF